MRKEQITANYLSQNARKCREWYYLKILNTGTSALTAHSV